MNANIIRNAVLFAIVALVLHIIASIAWLAIYAGAIDPGHALPYYEAYAVEIVDTLGLIAGIPILFVAGWLIGRSATTRADGAKFGALVGIAFIVIDLIVLFGFSAGAAVAVGPLVLSYATKLVAAIVGGWLAGGRAAKTGTAL